MALEASSSDAQSQSKTLPSVQDLSEDTQLLESTMSTKVASVNNVTAATENSQEGASPASATVETSVGSITTNVVTGFESPGRFGKKASDRRKISRCNTCVCFLNNIILRSVSL